MPWAMTCCHAGCLLFIEGINTRMGQKAACGAKGGIMDRTKSRITPDEPEVQKTKLNGIQPLVICYNNRPSPLARSRAPWRYGDSNMAYNGKNS